MVLFVLTDQTGKVSATHPPLFMQDWLTLGVYRLEADQTEKTMIELLQPSDQYYCDVSTNYKWARGQIVATCTASMPPGSLAVKLQTGDHLRIKLTEFDFEQVVEVNRPMPTAATQSGTRLLLAADCSGTSSASEVAARLKQTAQIIWYRLSSYQNGGLFGAGVGSPSVQIKDCVIEVELPAVSDPTLYIDLIQPIGHFELIDAGQDSYAIGDVIRTTGNPLPTLPSNTLQLVIPATVYEVVAIGADLDLTHLGIINAGRNQAPQLSFGFTGTAAQKIAQVTAASANGSLTYHICLVLDNVVQTCPAIREPLTDGRGVVQFDDYTTANRLASLLRFGELPLGLHVVKTETIR